MIYLAQPYSALDPYIRELRYKLAVKAIAELAHGGLHVYSPIVHWHIAARAYDLPKDAAFWWEQNKSHIDSCKAVCTLCLPGWDTSKGMKQEVQYALSRSYPITDAIIYPESVEAFKTFKTTKLIFQVVPSDIHPGNFLAAGDGNGKDNSQRGVGREGAGDPLGR